MNYDEAGSNKGAKKEFDPIAEGTYEAIVTEVKIGKSSSGNDMITATLTIRDDVDQKFGKRKLWDYIVDTDKTKWKIQQVAKAIGLDNGKKINTIQEFAQHLQYGQVKITIKHQEEEYNGEKKTRERISNYSASEVAKQNVSKPDPFVSTSAKSDFPI